MTKNNDNDPFENPRDSLIDRQFAEANARGDFDNLVGAGKPIRIEDRHVPEHLRMAYKIMKDHEVVPEWIAEQQLIDAELEKAHKVIDRSFRYFQQNMKTLQDRKDIDSVRQRFASEDQWTAAQNQFRQTIVNINKKILAYNLKVPAVHLTRNMLDPEREITQYV